MTVDLGDDSNLRDAISRLLSRRKRHLIQQFPPKMSKNLALRDHSPGQEQKLIGLEPLGALHNLHLPTRCGCRRARHLEPTHEKLKNPPSNALYRRLHIVWTKI